MKIVESCPKCSSEDVIFNGNWTGVMASDVNAEHFWLAKCNSCGFTFKPSSDDKPDSISDMQNHA